MENGDCKQSKGGDCTQNDIRKKLSQDVIIREVFSKVDNFIDDLENGRIEFTSDAETLVIYESTKGRLGRTNKKIIGKFLNSLGSAISDYKSSVSLVMRWEYAKECLRYIDWAYSWGIVVKKDLAQKLKSLEEENSKLKQLKDQLEKENSDLKIKITDQRKLLEKCGIREIGTVENNGNDE